MYENQNETNISKKKNKPVSEAATITQWVGVGVGAETSSRARNFFRASAICETNPREFCESIFASRAEADLCA
jgi:hypothetical protein